MRLKKSPYIYYMDNFISNENKALLWQFLTDQGAFNNIPNNYLNKVQITYESIINNISKMTQYNLTDKNKLVIIEMQKNLVALTKMDKPQYKNNQSEQRQLKKPSILSKPLEEVKIQLNEDYRNKQEEFIQLVNHNKPKEIEFSDKEDKPLDSDVMNNMLNNMMSMREKELMQSSFGNENKKIDKEREKDKDREKDREIKLIIDNDNFMSKLKTIKKSEVKKEPDINNFLIEEIVNNQNNKILENQNNKILENQNNKILENQKQIMYTLTQILHKFDNK